MSELPTGRVLRVDAKVVHVDLAGVVVQASPRGQLFEARREQKNPIAVGDLVRLSLDGDPVGVEEVLERRNYLGRVASSHDPREQVLVANVDQLFMIGSVADPGFSSNRTDRILAACVWHEIPATLVLNKIDLVERAAVAAIRRTYEAIPIPVLETCARDGRGVDELRERLRGRVTVFYGPSGAGKSSLANAVQPGLRLREGRISRYWQQGRHTTSHSEYHPLAGGGAIIDTPGIRVFRPYGVTRAVLADLFPDFAPFQARCRYDGCTHDHEPECGVADAAETGLLAGTRYASYLELLDEIDPEGAPEPAPGDDDEPEDALGVS